MVGERGSWDTTRGAAYDINGMALPGLLLLGVPTIDTTNETCSWTAQWLIELQLTLSRSLSRGSKKYIYTSLSKRGPRTPSRTPCSEVSLFACSLVCLLACLVLQIFHIQICFTLLALMREVVVYSCGAVNLLQSRCQQTKTNERKKGRIKASWHSSCALSRVGQICRTDHLQIVQIIYRSYRSSTDQQDRLDHVLPL